MTSGVGGEPLFHKPLRKAGIHTHFSLILCYICPKTLMETLLPSPSQPISKNYFALGFHVSGTILRFEFVFGFLSQKPENKT